MGMCIFLRVNYIVNRVAETCKISLRYMRVTLSCL